MLEKVQSNKGLTIMRCHLLICLPAIIWLLACSSASNSVISDAIAQPDSIQESNPDEVVNEVTINPSTYNPCVTVILQDTEYTCLKLRTCIDSNGIGFFNDMYDSCHVLNCQWKTHCNGNVYCLPELEQTRVTYADSECSLPLVQTSEDHPPQYVSLDYENLDHKICVDIFELNKKWVDNGTFYYLAKINGKNYCVPMYIEQDNMAFYYLYPVTVNPVFNFVPQAHTK